MIEEHQLRFQGESALLDRLRGRGRDDEEAINRRFAEAAREISAAHESGIYDVFVINDDLRIAQDEACSLVEQRRGRLV